MLLGCHISIAGGIAACFERAALVGCESFQIFTQNQRRWKSVTYNPEEITSFKQARKKHGFDKTPLVAHASYLINLCARQAEKLQKSRNALSEELQRCAALGIDYLVIHPGAHGGTGEDYGLATIAETLNSVLQNNISPTIVLLETTAGQGSGLGYRFEHLQKIIEQVEQDNRLGVCVDTCHIFAAGYNIASKNGWQNALEQMADTFGLNRIKVFHLNDSLKEAGSRRDRHAALGKGFIGWPAFERLLREGRFAQIPGLLEVPGGMDVFAEDIALLKQMRRKTQIID